MLSTADILAAIPDALLRVDLTGLGPRQEGKVRDIYVHQGKRILDHDRPRLGLRHRARRDPLQRTGAQPAQRLVVRPGAGHRGQPRPQRARPQRHRRPRGPGPAGRGHRARLHHRRDQHLAVDAVSARCASAVRARPAARSQEKRSVARTGDHTDHQGHRRCARRTADLGRGGGERPRVA